jgi:hypothetical protein
VKLVLSQRQSWMRLQEHGFDGRYELYAGMAGELMSTLEQLDCSRYNPCRESSHVKSNLRSSDNLHSFASETNVVSKPSILRISAILSFREYTTFP